MCARFVHDHATTQAGGGEDHGRPPEAGHAGVERFAVVHVMPFRNIKREKLITEFFYFLFYHLNVQAHSFNYKSSDSKKVENIHIIHVLSMKCNSSVLSAD